MSGDWKQIQGTFWDAGHVLFLKLGPVLLCVISWSSISDSFQLYILVCALQIEVEPLCRFGLLTGVHRGWPDWASRQHLLGTPEYQCLKIEHRCVCFFCYI